MKSLSEIYLSKWSKQSDTYKTMRWALDRLARAFGGTDGESFAWHELRFDDTRGIAAQLKDEGLAPKSINKTLSALRGVLEVAWRSEELPDNAYRKIKIQNVRGGGEHVGRALELNELDEIERQLEFASLKEAALIAVLLGAGLRRIEATRLKTRDYDLVTGRLRATGKGDKIREIPVGERWRKFIVRWRDTLAPSELMFVMTRRQVSLVVDRFCEERKLKKFTPHDLRKTFATHICRVSDIAIAQRLLGHANIQTTATIYDRRGTEAEDEAVKGL